MKEILLTLIAIICGAICILTSGVVICTNFAPITENLSRATATVDTAKFNRDQLVQIAQDTRAYVTGEISKNDLYGSIEQVNKDASTVYSDLQGSDFAAISDEYSLDKNCMNHLDEVKSLFANIKIAFGICSFAALASILLLLVLCGRTAMGRALCLIALTILVLLAVFGVWAIIDFNGMFNWLHSLFFTNNSWLFKSSSLIISMYPTAFWATMGGICIVTAFIEALILLIVGKIIK